MHIEQKDYLHLRTDINTVEFPCNKIHGSVKKKKNRYVEKPRWTENGEKIYILRVKFLKNESVV